MTYASGSRWKAPNRSQARQKHTRPSSTVSSRCGHSWCMRWESRQSNKMIPDDHFRADRPHRMRRLTLIATIAVMSLCVAHHTAQAQSYPARPITLVVPLPPGGTNDIMARAVADKLSASLGQQVVIENRAAGGSGSVGTRQVAHGVSPDGYTILLGYTSTLATGPSLFRNAGYDPRKDFAPIGLIASAPALLLVYPSFPARNVEDLIAIMKSSTEPFQLGTPGIGTVNYLAAVLFAQQAGVKVQYIPYKG